MPKKRRNKSGRPKNNRVDVQGAMLAQAPLDSGPPPRWMTDCDDLAEYRETNVTHWKPDDVAARLRAGGKALHHIRRPGPSAYRSSMPDPIISFWEMWNQLSAAEREERMVDFNRTRIHPTPDQIRAMDQMLEWIQWIEDPRNRTVVLAKAGGASFRKISFFDGRSHETLRTVWNQSVGYIARRLNA